MTAATKTNMEPVVDSQTNHGTKKTLRVAVGSQNPVKVNAVQRAIQSVVTLSHLEIDVQVQGFDVPSNVSHQPFGDVSATFTVSLSRGHLPRRNPTRCLGEWLLFSQKCALLFFCIVGVHCSIGRSLPI